MDEKFAPHIFLGYPASLDGYIYLDPRDQRVIVSHDVKFIEEDFAINHFLSDNDTDLQNITSLVNKIVPPLTMSSQPQMDPPLAFGDEDQNKNVITRLYRPWIHPLQHYIHLSIFWN